MANAGSGSSAKYSTQAMWLGLALAPQVGPTRSRRLVEHFGGIDNVFRASLTELEAAGLTAVSAQSIHNRDSLARAEEELLRATAAGAAIVTLDDPQYPSQLRQI